MLSSGRYHRMSGLPSNVIGVCTRSQIVILYTSLNKREHRHGFGFLSAGLVTCFSQHSNQPPIYPQMSVYFHRLYYNVTMGDWLRPPPRRTTVVSPGFDSRDKQGRVAQLVERSTYYGEVFRSSLNMPISFCIHLLTHNTTPTHRKPRRLPVFVLTNLASSNDADASSRTGSRCQRHRLSSCSTQPCL